MPRPKSMSQAEPDEADNNHPAELDPLIDALLIHLPVPGESFPARKLWMQILELALELIYPPDQGPEDASAG